MIQSLYVIHASLSALSAVIVAFVLLSRRTKGLTNKRFNMELLIAILVFSLAGVFELLNNELLKNFFDVTFSILLMFALWRRVKEASKDYFSEKERRRE